MRSQLITGALVAQSLLVEASFCFGEFAALMVLAYSVAAHGSRAVAGIGAVAALAAVVVHAAAIDGPFEPVEATIEGVYAMVAIAAGRVSRARTRRTIDAERRLHALDDEHAQQVRAQPRPTVVQGLVEGVAVGA